MAVFRVEKNSGYTVMSNHHLRKLTYQKKKDQLQIYQVPIPFLSFPLTPPL